VESCKGIFKTNFPKIGKFSAPNKEVISILKMLDLRGLAPNPDPGPFSGSPNYSKTSCAALKCQKHSS
jgi:hypothetical protein